MVRINDERIKEFVKFYQTALEYGNPRLKSRLIDHANWNTCAVGYYMECIKAPKYDYGKPYTQWPILDALYSTTNNETLKMREILHNSATYGEMLDELVEEYGWLV